ncbi:unnamed protein product [Peniophora sp. CBMAI 1063]|nr:unnamed protein product [Peniophora sp. CBMAI 1063]
MYISRGTRKDFHAAFSLTAFSSKEVRAPYHNLEELTKGIYSRAHHAARISAFFSLLNMGDEDRAGDALGVLAPLLAKNSVRHLILDELSTAQWETAVPGLLRTCLSKVTTLHCVDSCDPVGKQLDMYPCTAALRRLKATDVPEVERDGSPKGETPPTPRPEYPLPALKTVVVSMMSKPAEKYWTIKAYADVREWWDELVKGLTYRRDIGLRVRTLRIVGALVQEKWNSRMAKVDAKMLGRMTEYKLVDEVIDERTFNPPNSES